jgi:large subunit ribosomal protein L18
MLNSKGLFSAPPAAGAHPAPQGLRRSPAPVRVPLVGKHIYAQVIDDAAGQTLVAASSVDKALKEGLKTGADKAAAVAVGKLIAERASEGHHQVVFDRGGYLFHGRVKALADAAREAGLKF